jgi:ferredoxin
MKVWIDQDLCTGVGLFYVKESEVNFGTEKLFDGAANLAGSDGMARILESGLEAVIEAAEECPGECIFIEVDG